MPRELESVFRPTPPQQQFLLSPAKVRSYGGAMGGGKSRTLCEAAFDYALEYPGLKCLIARSQHTSIVETTKKTMMEQVVPPDLIDHSKASQGEDYVQLWNGSRFHFVGLDNPLRWYSSEIGLLLFDEAQEIEEDKVIRLMTRLRQPGMPHKVMLAFNPSSPGHWLQRWFILGGERTDYGFRKPDLYATGANSPIGDAEFFFAKATDNPYLPEGYVEQTLQGMPEHLRRRYLEGLWEFISGTCFFESDALQHYEQLARETKPLLTGMVVGDIEADIKARLRKEPIEKSKRPHVRKGDGPLAVWKLPVRETRTDDGPKAAHRYVLSVDVSSGGSIDYSAIHVVDVDTFEQAAEWQGKLPPHEVAQVAYLLGRVYNDALIVPEITGGWGYAVQQELTRYRYPRMFTRKILDRISRKWTDRLGWDTTTKSRAHMLDTLERVLREREFGLYSLRTVQELGSFVYPDEKNGRIGAPSAQPGMNDDLVLSLAIGVTVAADQPRQIRRPKKEAHRAQFSATGY